MSSVKRPPPIGAMRDRFVLEAPTRTADGSGGVYETWIAIAEVWGALIASSGSERFVNGRIEGRITHEVWIRARADVAPSTRLRLGTRLLHIRAVLIGDQVRHRMRLLCEERDL
ncbi:MAG: phage head closure protein [Hyphomicrobiaceae bacterium]